MKRWLVLSSLALLLSGCWEVKSAVSSFEPFHIAKVEAWGPSADGSSDAHLRDLRDQTRQLAALAPRTNNPLLLRLWIEDFHQKDPGRSLVIADDSTLKVYGEVFSLDGQQQMGAFSVKLMQDYWPNGIAGAILAATAKTDEVQSRLDAEAANALLEKIYGSQDWHQWSKNH